MSLDVYLEGPPEMVECNCPDCGDEHSKQYQPSYYQANITHNLGTMAEAAGIYQALWRPEELGITTAAGLVPLLETGLAKLITEPDTFSRFDAPNGWGRYVDFVPFVLAYLRACQRHPSAKVRVSR